MIIQLIIVLFFIRIPIYCQLFCDDPTVKSALSRGEQTYLFRDKQFWVFRPKYASVSQEPRNIQPTFKDPRIESIDTIFLHIIVNQINLTYIFTGYKYYFSNMVPFNQTDYEFTGMTAFSQVDTVPQGWNQLGGNLSNWFPTDMDDAIVLNDSVFLFHGSSVRFAKLSNDWPNQSHKTELPFEGSLKSIARIDAIFELNLKKEIVIIVGLKYCQFSQSQIELNFGKHFNINCEWKDSPKLFGCKSFGHSTTPNSTDDSTNVTVISDTGMTSTDTDYSTDSGDSKLIIILVLVFFIFITIIIGFIFFISVLVSNMSSKRKSGKEINRGDPSLVSRGESIVTINSETGKPEDPTARSTGRESVFTLKNLSKESAKQ